MKILFSGKIYFISYLLILSSVGCSVLNEPGPEVIKLFFMLNSAEHEICPNKSKITNNFKLFLAKHS